MPATTTSRRRATPQSCATSSGARELFGLDWDETSVDEAARYAQIRKPDGVQDSIQQIRHGTLQLLAQYDVFGHAIVGIVDPTLQQYTHLGDAASQTDGRVYDAKLATIESKGDTSGNPDDRWAFTTDSARQRSGRWPRRWPAPAAALRESDPKLAAECAHRREGAVAGAAAELAANADPSDGRGSPGILAIADAAATHRAADRHQRRPPLPRRLEQLLADKLPQLRLDCETPRCARSPSWAPDYRAQLAAR